MKYTTLIVTLLMTAHHVSWTMQEGTQPIMPSDEILALTTMHEIKSLQSNFFVQQAKTFNSKQLQLDGLIIEKMIKEKHNNAQTAQEKFTYLSVLQTVRMHRNLFYYAEQHAAQKETTRREYLNRIKFKKNIIDSAVFASGVVVAGCTIAYVDAYLARL